MGSGSQSPGAYQSALEMAAEVFLHAASLGFQLTLLDIGGGYPGSRGSREVFERVASAVRASLEELFSRYPHLTVIAEPGVRGWVVALALGVRVEAAHELNTVHACVCVRVRACVCVCVCVCVRACVCVSGASLV